MDEPTPYQKLDTVLNFIKNNDIVYKDELITYMDKLSITRIELGRIVALLIKNDHITENKSITVNKLPFYVCTFDGYLYIGYEKQKILDEDRIISIAQMAIETKKYNTRLLWATWCAGIGAFLVLIWQVFLYLYPVHADYPYWFWKK